MRKSPEDRNPPPGFPRWHRWLNQLPAGYYLLAALVVAALIIAFVLWLDARTLVVVSGFAFLALLLWFCAGLWLRWREAEPFERIIGVAGCVLLLAVCAVKLVQFFYLR
jgi:hypothetical protein